MEASWRWKCRYIYTVSHKKTCHFVFDYNSGFSWSIFILFAPVKDERILYTGVSKIYHFTLTVSPHYLVNLKRHMNSIFWSQSSQCVRSNRLLATYAECSIQCSSFPILGRKFFYHLLLKKLHSHKFLKKIGLSSNSTYLTWWCNCMKQTFVTCDVMQLWRHQAIK